MMKSRPLRRCLERSRYCRASTHNRFRKGATSPTAKCRQRSVPVQSIWRRFESLRDHAALERLLQVWR